MQAARRDAAWMSPAPVLQPRHQVHVRGFTWAVVSRLFSANWSWEQENSSRTGVSGLRRNRGRPAERRLGFAGGVVIITVIVLAGPFYLANYSIHGTPVYFLWRLTTAIPMHLLPARQRLRRDTSVGHVSTQTRAATKERSSKTTAWAVAAAVLLLMLAGMYWLAHQTQVSRETKKLPVVKPAASRPSGTPSIAVLPFVNMSKDEDQEYLAEGLAEVGDGLADHSIRARSGGANPQQPQGRAAVTAAIYQVAVIR